MFKKLRVIKFHAISLLYDLKAKVRPYNPNPDRLKEKIAEIFGEDLADRFVYEVNIWDDPDIYISVVNRLEEYYEKSMIEYDRWHRMILRLNAKDDGMVVDGTVPGYIMITER